jgi:hypothetical protein
MAEYIEREAVLNGVALYMAENAYLNDTALDVLKMVGGWLTDAPAADVSPVKHGRWDKNHDEDNIVYCDQCYIPQDMSTPYCHNCGAKMTTE